MLSEEQLAANRENAKKSTGPTSIEGKQRSSLNAVRHGLTGQVVVLPQEDIDAFNRFSAPLIASLRTDDGVEDAHEAQLALMYVNFLWKINRCSAVEDSMFTLGIMEHVAENLNIDHAEIHNAATAAKTFRNEAPAFDRLGIYLQRLLRNAERVLKQLKQCQAERLQRQEQELAVATRLYKFHLMQEQPFDPRPNGFDCSTDQIKLHIYRETLDAHSKIAERVGYSRPRFVEKCADAA